MAHLDNRCACPPTHHRSSFLTNDTFKFISVLSTSVLPLQLYSRRLAVRFVFLQPPAVLPTVPDVSPQTIDTISVSPFAMEILGVSPNTTNSFGTLTQELLFGVLSQEPLFSVLPTQNTSRHLSPPALRRHLRLGVLSPLSSGTSSTVQRAYGSLAAVSGFSLILTQGISIKPIRSG